MSPHRDLDTKERAVLDAAAAASARSERGHRQLTWIGLALLLLLTGYVFAQSYAGRLAFTDDQRAACRVVNASRFDTARAFRAQSTYLELVLQAKSVKEDVKDAARSNQEVQDRVATRLEQRARVPCSERFRSPSILPWEG